MSGHKWCDRNDGRCDSLALPDIDTALATGVLSLGNNHNYYNECCVILLGHLCVSLPPTSMGTLMASWTRALRATRYVRVVVHARVRQAPKSLRKQGLGGNERISHPASATAGCSQCVRAELLSRCFKPSQPQG